jgi:hypothetical protein
MEGGIGDTMCESVTYLRLKPSLLPLVGRSRLDIEGLYGRKQKKV